MQLPSVLVSVFLLASAAGLQAQSPASGPPQVRNSWWAVRPLPRELGQEPQSSFRSLSSDSAKGRPFFLPRPGEHTAYWAGLGVGLALSPLLWCDGAGCGTVSKATTSLGLALVGAVGGLLLSRTF
jgi:hypothetical protein